MSFIRHARTGHYEEIVAQRARILAFAPRSHRRRILGLRPSYWPADTHGITVDPKTGDREVVSDTVTAPGAMRVADPLPPTEPAPIPLSPRSAMRAIVEAVAEAFGVTTYQLYSAARLRPLSRARFACYRLASIRGGFSQAQIGRLIGRDHTSVLHGIRRARDLYEHDADWRTKCNAAVASLDGGAK